tara:strand:+ start:237 stop:1247 length:1011 start_codon:yes stop_codon:yes gene_type:complete
MNIYQDYLDNIQLAMRSGKKRKMYTESFDSFGGNIQKGLSAINLAQKISDDSLLPSLNELATEIGSTPNFNQKLGLHPDFSHLKGTNDTEKHYIISTFIDIKKSTDLFKKYLPEAVLIVNDTIQKAAIHTCLIFGGYIHRLQGDGLFVYYGGKNVTKEEGVKQALLSTSLFSYFVKNDLKMVLSQDGIEDINTRIGIDLGHDDDVIWHNAGIGEISEVTTCSLHTSLAPKMQAFATSNGIVIGDHVKQEMKTDHDLITPVCHRTGNESDRYIFEIRDENFRYTQHDFDWLKFLKRQDFIITDQDNRLSFQLPAPYEVRHSDNIRPIAIKSNPYYNF